MKVGVGDSPGFQPCDLSDRTRFVVCASPEREKFLCCEIGCNFVHLLFCSVCGGILVCAGLFASNKKNSILSMH